MKNKERQSTVLLWLLYSGKRTVHTVHTVQTYKNTVVECETQERKKNEKKLLKIVYRILFLLFTVVLCLLNAHKHWIVFGSIWGLVLLPYCYMFIYKTFMILKCLQRMEKKGVGQCDMFTRKSIDDTIYVCTQKEKEGKKPQYLDKRNEMKKKKIWKYENLKIFIKNVKKKTNNQPKE